MAKFRFNLEGVLRHRLHIEREKQRAMAELASQMTAMQVELAQLEQTVSESTEDLRGSRLTGRLDMSFLAAHRRFVLGMRGKAMELVQKMARLQVQVDEAQRVLGEAAKQRKIMEKLKEKRFERWREELGRKELAALDEVGMQLSYANSVDADEAV